MQYPAVEILTGILFVTIGLAPLSLPLIAIGLFVVSLCVAIAVYDIRHMLIPDRWNYLFLMGAFSYGVLSSTSFTDVLVLCLAGPVVALPLWALWAFSHGAWMGFGDVKFALGIGWLLGMYSGFVALLGAFIIGALVSVLVLLPLESLLSYAQKRGLFGLRRHSPRFTMTSEVPFGPFLIVSCLTIWFFTLYGIDLPLVW